MKNNLPPPRAHQRRVNLLRIAQHRTTKALLVGGFVFLTLYVLSYLVLVRRGERRAKERGDNGYYLVFSDAKLENYESLACACYWPIYSLDTGYEDDRLHATCMISKNSSLWDFARHYECRLLEWVGLD